MQPKSWEDLVEISIKLKSKPGAKFKCNSSAIVYYICGYDDLQVTILNIDSVPDNQKAVNELYMMCRDKLIQNYIVMQRLKAEVA
jgi:hypothetical protein